jgi:hypothetical protein
MYRMIAKSDRACFRCRETIPAGTGFYAFKERALSSYEALHAGRYPERKCCCACAAKRATDAGKSLRAMWAAA